MRLESQNLQKKNTSEIYTKSTRRNSTFSFNLVGSEVRKKNSKNKKTPTLCHVFEAMKGCKKSNPQKDTCRSNTKSTYQISTFQLNLEGYCVRKKFKRQENQPKNNIFGVVKGAKESKEKSRV